MYQKLFEFSAFKTLSSCFRQTESFGWALMCPCKIARMHFKMASHSDLLVFFPHEQDIPTLQLG